MLFFKKKEKIFWIVLIFFILISRFIFKSNMLYHWDSVQFALATRDYNVSLHQPQPPGYPLYVLLGKIFKYYFLDENFSYIVLNIFLTILSCLFLFKLSKKIFNKEIAFISVLFYVFSPLVWFHSEVTFSYLAEGFFIILFAYYLYNEVLKTKDNLNIYLATIVLAMLGGVRQNSFILMLPLYFFYLFKKELKIIVCCFLLLVVCVLLWAVPMLALSGGLKNYLLVNKIQYLTIVKPYTVMGGGISNFFRNLLFITFFIFLALGILFYVLIISGYKYLRNKNLNFNNFKIIFFSLWIVSSLLFYALIHINNPGYIFTFLPALFILSAKFVSDIIKNASLKFKYLFLIFLCGFNFLMFLFVPLPTSYAEIKTHDNQLSERINFIQKNFPAKKSVIVTLNYFYFGFRHFMYYLPNYDVYELKPFAIYTNGKIKGKEYPVTKFFKFINLKNKKYIILVTDPRTTIKDFYPFFKIKNFKEFQFPDETKIYYLEVKNKSFKEIFKNL